MNVRICQSPLGFSIDQTNNTIEVVNEWPLTVNFRNDGTPFGKYYKNEKELMPQATITGNAFL